MDKVYYEPQDNWTREEYYYLYRQLHRLFYYYKKYSEEISKMDVDRMSDETKAMIYCIIIMIFFLQIIPT